MYIRIYIYIYMYIYIYIYIHIYIAQCQTDQRTWAHVIRMQACIDSRLISISSLDDSCESSSDCCLLGAVHLPRHKWPGLGQGIGCLLTLTCCLLTNPPSLWNWLIDSCITQLKTQGPSRTCNESKEKFRSRR